MLLILFACATLSDDKTYVVARDQFNTQVSTYLDAYDQADPETQARWKAEIDPQIRSVDLAFKAWNQSLTSGTATAEQREATLKAKDMLIDMLVEVTGGVK